MSDRDTTPAGIPAPHQNPEPPQEVVLHDAFGRSRPIPREDWRKDVLPKMVDGYAHAPDQLAGMIMQHVRQGLAEDLVPAAIRLAANDPEPDRGLTVLSTVQIESGDLESARNTIDELLQKRPGSVMAKVCEAMWHDRSGDRAAATDKMWEALQLDCNHPDAVHGYLQFEFQRVGADGYAAVLEKVCALPQSWRAQLWRARHRLEVGDRQAAADGYRAVAESHGDQPDALLMIGTDLMGSGQVELFRELVAPRYDIARHHPQVGIAMLRYHVHTGQPEPGLKLLHELRVRFQRVFDQQLVPLDAQLTQQLVQSLPPPPAVEKPRVVLYRMDRPIWFGLLGEPAFLAGRPQDAKTVLFSGLAAVRHGQTQQVAGEDEVSRMTRSLPLFLAEQLWYGSTLRTGVALPVSDAGGWVVSAQPWAEDRMAELLAEPQGGAMRIVSGVVHSEGKDRRVELWVYDAASKERIGQIEAKGEQGKVGEIMLQLLNEISPLVGGPATLQMQHGTPETWDRYAAGLAQVAALMVAKSGAMPKERIYGHRAILEWLLAVALEQPNYVPARLLLSAALCGDAMLGSDVHKELAAPLAELFRLEPANSPFAQTALLPLKHMGLSHIWQHRRDQILAAGGDPLRAWVEQQGG
jgi:hypothetical protein